MKTQKVRITTLWMLSFMLIIVAGCKKDNGSDNKEPIPKIYGYITGTVTTPSGKPIGGAKVCIAKYEDLFFTYTANNGDFKLKAPIGNYELRIYTGSGNLFNTETSVTVLENDTLELHDDSTVLTQERSIAYVAGIYDDIQSIVIDSLGYQATEIQTIDLENINLLQQYNLVLLNCGSDYSNNTAQVYTVLENFVTQGGNIYASDYAIDMLIGNNILKVSHTHTTTPKTQIPCSNAPLGGFIADSLLCASPTGASGLTITGQVSSPALQQILGNYIHLYYDLDLWVMLNYVELNDPRFEELIRNPSTNGTLAVKIDWNQTQAGGNIVYTTFHNEANATPDMLTFLEWVILQY